MLAHLSEGINLTSSGRLLLEACPGFICFTTDALQMSEDLSLAICLHVGIKNLIRPLRFISLRLLFYVRWAAS